MVSIHHLDTRYLDAITDHIGVWQHAENGNISEEHGYALDDSARGLIAALMNNEPRIAESSLGFIERVVSYDRVVNFIDAKLQPVDHPHSDDAIGEAVWALGMCQRYGFEVDRVGLLQPLLNHHVAKFDNHLRARAYAILGYIYLDLERVQPLAAYIFAKYRQVAREGWLWPESSIVYGNAVLPMALMEAGYAFGETEWQAAGRAMLDFLNQATKERGVPIAIGNKGWYSRGGQKALYDQQPIHPAYQVLANVTAFNLTHDAKYKQEAETYLSWFWGNNLLGKPLIDQQQGRCYDGLHEKGVSKNAGSENIVCYLMAQQAYESLG